MVCNLAIGKILSLHLYGMYTDSIQNFSETDIYFYLPVVPSLPSLGLRDKFVGIEKESFIQITQSSNNEDVVIGPILYACPCFPLLKVFPTVYCLYANTLLMPTSPALDLSKS